MPARVEVAFQRRAEKQAVNRKEREGIKERDLLKKYPQAKVDQLVKSLKERGLWYYDPDFPNDAEELWVAGEYVCTVVVHTAHKYPSLSNRLFQNIANFNGAVVKHNCEAATHICISTKYVYYMFTYL